MISCRSWGLTDLGKKRKLNEDALLADDGLGLYLVCDGMGGHAAGEVASETAIQTVHRTVQLGRDRIDAYGREPSFENRDKVIALMEEAFQDGGRAIWDMAQADATKRGMGTTCAALLCAGRKGIIGHVGDSRIYLLRNARVHQLTEDHTIIQEQLKRGLITREQAKTSDVRNVITRALGVQPTVPVDTLLTDLLPGDVYILCTDGLHGYLQEEELVQVFSGSDPDALPQALVDMSNERGGKDNITAVVVKVETDSAATDEEYTDVEGKMEALRRIPLFAHMTYKELLAVLAIARARTFRPGQLIIDEGATSDELYVLFRGRVDVVKNAITIASVQPGGHFGEMGLIDNGPRSASVKAVEPTSAIAISRDSLLGLMRRDQTVAVKLLWSFVQVLSERLRNTNEELTTVMTELKSRGLEPPYGGVGGN